MTRYQVSVCLIIKDEGKYLPEWLAWHVGQGVEHFYIYDNGSAVPVGESIPEEYQGMCTVVACGDWTDNQQTRAYNDCLERFGAQTKWLAFIDTDEFIRVVDGTPLPRFLEGYGDAAALEMQWIMYNANGHVHAGEAPVRQRFTQTVEIPYYWQKHKSIIQPDRCKSMTPHRPYVKPGEVIVDENGDEVGQAEAWLPAEKIAVDHYYTRSWEEWREKMARGQVMNVPGYRQDTFEAFNPGLVEEFIAKTKKEA